MWLTQQFLMLHLQKNICRSLSFYCARNMASSNKQECSTQGKKSFIGVVQMTAKSNKEENIKTILDLIVKASSMGAKMVFLPEACDYIADSKQDSIAMAESMKDNFMNQCQQAAKDNKVWLSVGGFHQKAQGHEGKIYNTHVLINSDGQVTSQYNKGHLFDLNIPDRIRLCESDYIIKGDKVIPPVPTPVGRLGMAICYDLRFPELSLMLRNQGAEILTFPSAFTQTTGLAHWEALLRTRAIETQCYVVAAAQTGRHNAKRTSFGHAMVVDPWGTVVAQCREGTNVCLAEIDLDYIKEVRSNMPIAQHRRPDLYGQVPSDANITCCVPPDEKPSYQFGKVNISSTQVFYRSLLSIAFVNIKPVLPGHILVAPIRPAAHLSDLSPAEVTDLFMVVQLVSEEVKRHFGATSMTVAVQDGPEAGQTVQHVHVHVIPRRRGDIENNDDIYNELQNHDRGWDENTKLRTEEEMAQESMELRKYFMSL